MTTCAWLVPSKAHLQPLRDEIAELAVASGSPVFEPHVTLFCGKPTDVGEVKEKFQQLSVGQHEINLTMQSIDVSDQYYKTLYVQLNKLPEIVSLVEQLKQLIDPVSDYVFNPHLSLMYKHMPANERAEVIKKMQLKIPSILGPNKTIVFDKIKLMTTAEGEDAAAVKSWQIIAELN